MNGKRLVGVITLFLFLILPLFASAQPDEPIVSGDGPEPAIHGPRVVGSTPGRPFLFRIPATGDGPLTFSVDNLPAGLTLDSATGIITGSLTGDGTFVTKVHVTNSRGEAARNLVIIGGQGKLAQTPPMGWNSWNAWGMAVDEAKVRAAADAFVDQGLAAYGFAYVNIDDGWEEGRDYDGTIIANSKFPSMKALGDYIHSRGLKFGIYSSPGTCTCGRLESSFDHEEQDVATWASWGVDYVKYDWCTYHLEIHKAGLRPLVDPLYWMKAPYIKLGKILAGAPRDIVYSICYYGMWGVERWGAKVGGNLWRTTGDITDTWESLSFIGFGQTRLQRKYEPGHLPSWLADYAGPGHWNDPDMLILGKVGWGPTLHETRLTRDEQLTHITMWSMLAAPLLIGCSMEEIDQWTLDLLTNHDVIEVDQDPLGRQARSVSRDRNTEVWARPLWDGTRAVALFNKTDVPATVGVTWKQLGISGPQPVRDLWRGKDRGEFNGSYSVAVPPHGAVLVKIGKPRRDDYTP